jgi:endonuclease/exonuclease/phosphatase family metal-dependent hydrolase
VFAGGHDKEFFFHRGRPLKVMTQNLYVGADLFRILAPSEGCQQYGQLEVPCSVAEIYSTVQQTNFKARVEAIADMVAEALPDLVGLQEVYRIHYNPPGDIDIGRKPNEGDEVQDSLKILRKALNSRGLHYKPVVRLKNADLTLPMFEGFDAMGGPILATVRVTDRDVILVRDGVAVSNRTKKHFQTNMIVPIGEMEVEFLRGYCAVDARVRDRTYRFVNAHLEVANPAAEETWKIQRAQAEELVLELAGETRPTILLGDFNSGPEIRVFAPAYDVLLEAGFRDSWHLRRTSYDPGYTCCQEEYLDNDVSYLDHRIDLILIRNDLGFLPFSIIGGVSAWVVGNDPEDRTLEEPRLWPSDHAGVAAKLRIPKLGVRH